MKFQSRFFESATNLICVISIAFISSCKNSTSADQFNPVGQWSYPQTGNMDSTLSSFSLKLWATDSVKFLGYLDGNLLDSTNGTWKYQNESLIVVLSECVTYGLLPITSNADALGHDSCVSQIKFTNDGTYLFDNTGKKYKRN